MRWAIFLPTPGMVEMALTSPAAMCATNSAGLKVESAEMAILGPIPLTARSFSKKLASAGSEKPNSEMLSSFTAR